MIRPKHLIIPVAVLVLICGLSAAEWSGFRGVDKNGRHDSAGGPLEWSSSHNVAWKTAIPGRGHSSPIVSGDGVYLTTSYEADHLAYRIWDCAIAALAVLLAVTGVSFAMRNLTAGQTHTGKVLQHVRLFLFTQILVAVLIVALLGPGLLDFGSSVFRPWLASVVLMLCCLALGSMVVPLKSRRQLAAGLVSLTFSAVVLLALRRKGLAFNLDSMRGVVTAMAMVSPAVFGLALLAGHFLSRRRQSGIVANGANAECRGSISWPFAMTGCVGFVVGVVPFLLLVYRAAEYRMPDSYIWDNRVNPDAGWPFIGICLVVGIIALGASHWKSIRSAGALRVPAGTVLPVLAIALGAAFFARAGLVDKPKEFTRALVCLDGDSGGILWKCEGLMGSTGGRSRTVTHASATPATDGERIFAYFGQDGLMCASLEGKLLWKKAEPMFCGQYGVGTSPVVKDNVLIVVRDVKESDALPSSIIAFNCATGGRLWERERKSHEFAAYGTPVVRSLNGQQAVIVHGWQDIKAYRLETGEELWSYPVAHEGKHLVASLTCDGERLYVTGTRRVRALDLSKLGTGNDPLVWSSPIPGEKSSTPVVVDGLIFLATENGMAFCLDSQTGDVLWKERLRGRYYSSVVAMAGRVLFTNESGQTTVVAVDREFRKLATNTLDESVYASFAPVGGRLFARTTKYLYCFQ